MVLCALASTYVPGARARERQTTPAPISSVDDRVLAAEPGHSLVFAVGDDVRILEVTREGVLGGGIELREFPGRLRGHVGAESVDLALAAPRITGQIGNHPVSLDMLPASEGIRVAGRFGERETALFVRPSAIDGGVGPCRYHLSLTRGRYAGQVGCGGEPEDVRLDIPAAFVAKADVEIAAILVAIFAR